MEIGWWIGTFSFQNQRITNCVESQICKALWITHLPADSFANFWLSKIGKLVSQSFGSIVQFLVSSIQFIANQMLTKTS